jgi:hypothetical protein
LMVELEGFPNDPRGRYLPLPLPGFCVCASSWCRRLEIGILVLASYCSF